MNSDDYARVAAEQVARLSREQRGTCSMCGGPHIQGPFLDSAHICKEYPAPHSAPILRFEPFKEEPAAVTPPEQAFSLAASPDADAEPDWKPLTDLEADALRLALIEQAQRNRASWAVIGRTLGMSRPEAKRHAKKLKAQVKRASLLATGEGG